jgi:putative cell wall-binding protein
MTFRGLRPLLCVAVVGASALVLVPGALAATPTLPRVWVHDLPGVRVGESSPALADVGSDGDLDVVFGGHDGKVWALRGTNGSVVPHWPQPTSNRIDSSPSLADVDGDGRPELFVGSGTDSENTGALYSFATDDGHVRFRRALADNDFPAGAPVRSSPAIADVNGDGALDVAVGALGVRSLWAVRGSDGTPLTGRDLFYWDDTIFSTPAVADVNGDGVSDVIVGGDSSPGPPVDWRGGMVRAVSGTGQPLWEFRTNDIVRSSPAVGDVDGDGRLDVVFGGGDFWHGSDGNVVFALDATNGALKWRRDTDGITNAAPALADIDGDGDLDVAMGTFNSPARGLKGGTVYALDGRTGRDLAGFPVASGGGVVLGGTVTVDADGDGAQDLIVPTGAYLAVFSGKTGQRLYNLAEGDSVGFQNSAAVADVDGNGKLDIVAVGTRSNGNGAAYRWELPSSARLGALGWHQFHKDTRRTGSWTSPVLDANTIPFSRRAGDDRYATAVALSSGVASGGVVYVATGAAFPDALAAGPAATSKGSAVLLVTRDAVPGVTRSRITELKPRQILVLGGPAAVSDAVVAELGQLATAGAMRLAGTDRYSTATAVSSNAFTTPLVPVVYVATGASFPDALTGGAAGSLRGGPILLLERDQIPSSTSTELRRLLPRSIVILGGTGAVSQEVETELHTYAADVSRIAGGDRYASAVAVSKSLFPDGAASALVATGVNFPDALAGGPVAASSKAPLLLVPGRCIPNVVRKELERLRATSVVLLGGEGAVSSTIGALNPCS